MLMSSHKLEDILSSLCYAAVSFLCNISAHSPYYALTLDMGLNSSESNEFIYISHMQTNCQHPFCRGRSVHCCFPETEWRRYTHTPAHLH